MIYFCVSLDVSSVDQDVIVDNKAARSQCELHTPAKAIFSGNVFTQRGRKHKFPHAHHCAHFDFGRPQASPLPCGSAPSSRHL